MRTNKQAGLSLIEIMFALCILTLAISFLMHSYVSSLAIDRATQETVICHAAVRSAVEALHDMSTAEIIAGGYVSTTKHFDVTGIAGVNPENLGDLTVEDVTPKDTVGNPDYSVGAQLRITATVSIRGIVRAKVVSHKYDGGGYISPIN